MHDHHTPHTQAVDTPTTVDATTPSPIKADESAHTGAVVHFHQRFSDSIEQLTAAARAGWTPTDLLQLCGSNHQLVLWWLAREIAPRVRDISWAYPAWLSAAVDSVDVPVKSSALAALQQAIDAQLSPLSDGPWVRPMKVLSPEQRWDFHQISALWSRAETAGVGARCVALLAQAERRRHTQRLRTIGAITSEQVRCVRFMLDRSCVAEEQVLLSAIAHSHDVVCVHMHDCGIVSLVGRVSDLHHVTQLMLFLRRLCTNESGTQPCLRLSGVARELVDAVVQVRVQCRDGKFTTFITRTQAEVRDYVSEIFPQLKTPLLSLGTVHVFGSNKGDCLAGSAQPAADVGDHMKDSSTPRTVSTHDGNKTAESTQRTVVAKPHRLIA
ncbi:MAG: hypothetical protein Q4A31_03085 [Corynebacterium sp.]|uniref:hypothetical protein n=1 Tax=Corynebacterium sp. TaxID=1720 RepID=UPI0026DCB6EA|nr:hypothetical protein [Corynebacterium sp.]MDO4760892.1 hypothetical protein [Corynebacterium sp.]